MRIIILFICCCLTTLINSVSAQDVFELTYQFKYDTTKTVYRGFLVNNGDATGFLRLTAINNNTRKRILYDFAISLKPYLAQDTKAGLMFADSVNGTYWYCRSEDFDIKEGNEIFNFDYLRFWFKQDSFNRKTEPCLETPFIIDDSYLQLKAEPQVVVKTSEAGSKVQAQLQNSKTGILSYKQLKTSSFTKTYLRQFFTSSELFYEGNYTKKQIIKVRNNDKPVLYLISVVNTDDKDISETCIEDGKRVTSYFKRVANFLSLPITVKIIKGNDFTVNAVTAAIKNIHPGKDDIVVFHYSGHGFSYKDDEKYPFPQMALYYGTPPTWPYMKASSINMGEIFAAIKAKGARLNMVMSDCCNTAIKKRRSEIPDTVLAQIPPGYYDMNKRTAIALFLRARTSMLISAAKQGQLAIGSRTYSGFFTTSIIESIRMGLKKTRPDPQWMDIIKGAESRTLDLAIKYEKEQNIIYKVCDSKVNTPCIQHLGYKIP